MRNLINEFELNKQFLVLSDLLAPMIFYFIVYSLIGWLLENTHSYFTRGTFIKPNFWFGPFKPMYGFAPLILIYSISNNTHWIFVLILCFFVPTIVEYISGVMLESFFHKKWWDYSGNQMHFQGHICLTYSVYWTFLSFLCISFIHPVVEFSYERIESYFQLVWPIIVVYCIIETFLAFWRHTLQNKSIETLG